MIINVAFSYIIDKENRSAPCGHTGTPEGEEIMEEQNNKVSDVQTQPAGRTIPQIIFGSAIWTCILAYILILAGQSLGLVVYSLSGAQYNDLGQTAGLYLMFAGIWLTFFLNALIRSNRPLFKAYGTGLSGNRAPQLLIGLLIGLVMNGALILFAAMNGDIHVYFDKIEIVPLVILLIAVFVQSSAEEFGCRGFVYYRVLRTYKDNYILAIAVNSAFFAALHLGNNGISPLAVVDLIVSGVLFSVMVYYFDSLWMAMGCHTGWNFMQSILIGLPNSGNVVPYSVFKLDAATARDSMFYNVAFGVEGTIPAILIQIVVIAAIVVVGRKMNVKRTDIWER